ncbi:unnamed protein product [Nezara viridula]|uniref:Uncharacterized protein n=1 Tax=Nezara viridula TaxID=85310 RepID=A0A9P0HH79_NEZVI|nr:unnamed protein product [Nezara viridula]
MVYPDGAGAEDIRPQPAIRHRFGCYDEITEVDRRRVRHCNWVRFLRVVPAYTDQVNLIGTKIKAFKCQELLTLDDLTARENARLEQCSATLNYQLVDSNLN